MMIPQINHHTIYGQIPTAESTPTIQPVPSESPTQQPIPSAVPTIQPLPTVTPTPSDGKGIIHGYVVNIEGEPIESVRLKLKGIATGISKITRSNVDGYFEFTELSADTYVIAAKKKGYKKARQTISLGVGEVKEIEIVLKKTTKGGPPSIVKGYVFDKINDEPIKDAAITVLGITGTYTTWNNGKYLIELDAGNYTLRTKATGYQTKDTKIKLKEGQTLTKNIGLKKKEARTLLPFHY